MRSNDSLDNSTSFIILKTESESQTLRNTPEDRVSYFFACLIQVYHSYTTQHFTGYTWNLIFEAFSKTSLLGRLSVKLKN